MRAVYGTGPKRIIVTMPPRHGKSETTSKWTPAWFLDHFPQGRVIVGSYEASFAASWGDKVRHIVSEYAHKLHVKRPPFGSANEWHTTEGGIMYTAGAGGGFTGKGANLFIIDDPIKNSEQASSNTYREKIWDWFTSTAYTRVEPGGVVLIVLTRWHHDDIAGRIIRKQEEQQRYRAEVVRRNDAKRAEGVSEDDLEEIPEIEEWLVIKMKAICEDADDPLGRPIGEALWPGRYARRDLLKIKSVVGPKVWRALYQQEPTPEEGDLFHRLWFRYFEPVYDEDACLLGVNLFKLNESEDLSKPTFIAADALRTFQTVDPAVSQKTSADYFVITTFLVTPDKDILVWHIERDRIPGPHQPGRLWNSLRLHKPLCVGIEAVGFQLALFQTMVASGFPAIRLNPDREKSVRAVPAGVHMLNGKVFFRVGAEWLDEFESELLQFPNGTHDDQVDTLAYAVHGVLFDEMFAKLMGRMDWSVSDVFYKEPTFGDEGVNGPNSTSHVKSLASKRSGFDVAGVYEGEDDNGDD